MRFVSAVICSLAALLLVLLPVASASTLGGSATDYLSEYTHTKSHAIIGSPDGDLSDYNVRFIVHRGSGTDNDMNVYLNGYSLRWPDDIRFTDDSNDSLSFWVESSDADTASIWVKVHEIPAYPAVATIKIFYGSASAVSASDGEGTWEFFDDFSSLDDSRWSTIHGSPSVSDGVITCQAIGSGDKARTSVETADDVSFDGSRVLAKVKTAHWNSTDYTEIFAAADADDRGLEADFSNSSEGSRGRAYINWIDGSDMSYQDIRGWSAGTWHILDAERLGDQIRWQVDYKNQVNCSQNYWTDPGVISFNASHDGAEISVDWVAVGLVTANEPAHGVWWSGDAESTNQDAQTHSRAASPKPISSSQPSPTSGQQSQGSQSGSGSLSLDGVDMPTLCCMSGLVVAVFVALLVLVALMAMVVRRLFR
ncbi:MAG TPA: DUF2341 domain-containing protein [Methanocella sp.]|nr:DUF2341 domain-containing protein [Methanocella sp.]